ncbi:MAG TPA: hypothetical protein VNJ54_16150 [Plantibacter sp.]|uniref:hypothetical protein n=1 Tax=unclassified Plantibacter TaxID=2624265 RepID=UPI002CD76E6F|nr:hypothetical protein [Plantibacter sp.]
MPGWGDRSTTTDVGEPMTGPDDDAQPQQPADDRPFADQILERRGFAVTAALFVMLGGIVVPFVGWVAGMVMLWRSRAWTNRQKWTATLAPIAATAVVFIVLALLSSNWSTTDAGLGGSPVIPVVFDLGWTTTILLMVSYVIAGAWLLWSALRPAAASVPVDGS